MHAARYRRLGITDVMAQKGFEMCRRATQRTGEIEYATTLLLPRELRVAIWALYGAARTIDDLAEESANGVGSERLRAWIRAFEQDVRHGGSEDPIRAALLHTASTWHLPPDYLRSVFEGQLADAAGHEFASWDDWYDYVALVNAPFVIQTASMFVQNSGLSVSLQQEANTLDVWQNLARAINLTDALADLGEDCAHGRIRLPAEALNRFGVRREELLEGGTPPQLPTLVHHLTGTARKWFANLPQLPPILHPAMGTALTCYIDLHHLLLDAVDHQADNLPCHRITVSTRQSRRLLLTARATTSLAWALFPSPLGDISFHHLAPRVNASVAFQPVATSQRQVPRLGGTPTAALPHVLPRHVAIIMDGNGRWAADQGRPRTDGHKAGMKALDDVVNGALEIGLSHLTVYAFSTENWKRPAAEVNALLYTLPHDMLQENAARWHERGVRIRWSGQRAGLPLNMFSILTSLVEQTRHNTRLTLTLCVNYGGRAEITTAASRLAADAIAGRIEPNSVGEALFATYLYLTDLPDVDLLLRTGGEKRLSNYLPWQTSYAELMFLDTPWPQFDRQALRSAIEVYMQRTRRHGAAEAPQATSV
ncbi:polyprenyl diphosphate synthase [Streptomyces spectabilis]|uniref:Isoprenyl transferase n=1 Tax=Streptomyces spectabilis TaxID=68270 RepID=A0A7W8EZC8_STRST|nr:polyprenyl diphosphate synthase [Streptomyces spectabilis]MBB5109781.1 undecaprenyl diphosphate synthase [Streptomyces spectabilis]GGV55537.1 hypothetical protein GCM10010245_88090 [Streptomyces spectabilis]